MAVQHIVAASAKPAPYVVFGPPGTGTVQACVCECPLMLKYYYDFLHIQNNTFLYASARQNNDFGESHRADSDDSGFVQNPGLR